MHSATWYMLCDIAGSLWGTVAFAAVAVAPGYVACRQLDLCGFRLRSPAEKLAWSVAVSFGLTPLLLVAVTWCVGITTAANFMGLMALTAAVVFLRETPVLRWRRGHGWFLLWTLFVVLSLVDVGWGGKLWMSVTTLDHSIRTPFIDAAMRTGVVPVNPLYWPGHDAPLRYYYFWPVVCAVVAKLAHISARQALVASCVSPMIGVVAMIALYGKYMLGWMGALLRSRVRLAVILLAVTGLDGLIALFVFLSGQASGGDMEWWSIDQVTSWVDTFLWVPHHAVALICCLLCLLLCWMARAEAGSSQRWKLGVVAGLSFASAFGSSTYVAVAFAIVMGFYGARILWTDRNRGQLQTIAIAAVVAAVALAPYVMQLSSSAGGSERQPHVLRLQVRRMLDPDILSGAPVVRALSAHKLRQRELEALILLLPGYCIEFGFFALVAWIVLRQKDRSEGERTLVYLFGASMVSVSFIRSAVITTNDYGIRATLLAQFFVLLLAVRVWEESRGWQRRMLFALAFVGVAGSVYQVLNLRFYLPWQQAHGNLEERDLAERNFALRDAYQRLDAVIPLDVRIQYGAPAGGFFDTVQTLQARRQLVASGTTGNDCNTGFGGEVSACAFLRATGSTLYAARTLVLTPPQAAGLCRSMGAQYLVVTRWDALFTDRSAWPWTLPAVVQTPQVRVVSCQNGM